MSDAEGDSTMHSSPELSTVDDDVFPDQGPSTPRNAASFALHPSSQFSPPNSQGRFPQDNLSALAGGGSAPSIINANGKRAHPSSVAAGTAASAADKKAGPVQTDAATGYQWSNAEDAPGHEWKSSRAREEEARAWDAVVDKGSMIKTCYGDPLKPEVPMTLKR